MAENGQQISDSAVKAIQQSVETKTIEVDGVNFVTRQVYDPPKASTVETLAIATLSGLVEYVRTQRISTPSKAIIQVEGPNAVAVKGPISEDRSKQRDVYARATAHNACAKGFQFGRYHALEEFNILLRTLFGEGGDRDAIIAVLGNVQGSKVVDGQDDGFSQAVIVKRNVVKVGEEQVKNPVRLQPYRTFDEIYQTQSEFILRLKGDPDNEDPPTVALFEADGGAWVNNAIQGIVEYLKRELPDEVVIG